VEEVENIWLGVQKHRKIEKVTGSQDDGLMGVLKNILVGFTKNKRNQKVTTSQDARNV